MLWLIFTLFLSRWVVGKNPEPADMYDDETAVGVDPYEVALAEDKELEKEVAYYNGEDLKDSVDSYKDMSEYDITNYEESQEHDNLEDVDSDSRLLKDQHQHPKVSHEEAVSVASSQTTKKKKYKKKKVKQTASIQDSSEEEHDLSITSQDDEITQMQNSIEKDQLTLQSLMKDFNKKLGAYENSKTSLETSLGHSEDSEDSDEIAVGAFEDFNEFPIGIFEDLEELPVGIFEDFEEIPVGDSLDFDELPVGEEFDYDEWLEKELGEMPLEYTQWHEQALGEIEKMEDENDLYDDPEDDLQDFEETLVGDPLEELHADMNDMFENILYGNSDEDPVGDSLDFHDDDDDSLDFDDDHDDSLDFDDDEDDSLEEAVGELWSLLDELA